MSKMEYKDLIAFHPGYYVKEMIEYEGMSQDELANNIDYKFWENLDVVATVSKRIDKVKELQKYFRKCLGANSN